MIIDTDKIKKGKVLLGLILLMPFIALVGLVIYFVIINALAFLEVFGPIIIFLIVAFVSIYGVQFLMEGLKGK